MIAGRFDPDLFREIVPPDPIGAYERGILRGSLGMLSGQFPLRDGELLYTGRVGIELTEDQGKEAAFLAASNALAQIVILLDGFDRLEGLLRLDGYVASAPNYTCQPAILDIASQLFRRVLGDKGRHARTAFSVGQLPLGAPVELAISFAVGR